MIFLLFPNFWHDISTLSRFQLQFLYGFLYTVYANTTSASKFQSSFMQQWKAASYSRMNSNGALCYLEFRWQARSAKWLIHWLMSKHHYCLWKLQFDVLYELSTYIHMSSKPMFRVSLSAVIGREMWWEILCMLQSSGFNLAIQLALQ